MHVREILISESEITNYMRTSAAHTRLIYYCNISRSERENRRDRMIKKPRENHNNNR